MKLPKKINKQNYKKASKIIFSLTLLLSLYFTLNIIATNAQTLVAQRSFTAIPPTVSLELKPGDRTEGVMKLANNSDEAITFKVGVQDYTVSDTMGTPNILPPGSLDNRYSASSWIAIAPSYFTIQPHEKQEVNYYVQIPQEARPGGHYAAAVYSPANIAQNQGVGAAVNTQIGTLFYFDVAGDINEQATIEKFTAGSMQEYGPINILTEIKNLGDLHIKPVGSIVVTNMLGQKQISNLDALNIFPGGGIREYKNTVGGQIMFGKYEAKLMASYGRNNDKFLSATISFWVFPWKITLLVVLIIIAIILFWKFMKKRNSKKQTVSPEVEDQTAN